MIPEIYLSRLSTAPRFKAVRPLVEMFMRKTGNPVPCFAIRVEGDTNIALTVERISLAGQRSEVTDAVVVLDPVDVVKDRRRLNPVVHFVSNAVGLVAGFLVDNSRVTLRANVFDGGSGLDASAVVNRPPHSSGIRAVAQHINQFLWDNLCIHSVSPHVVARGPVVGATGYPELYPKLGVYC